MKVISVSFDTPHPVEFWWSHLSDIPNYDNYIPFVRNIRLHGDLKPGSFWYDTTTIGFIPIRTRHNIVVWKKNEKIVFEVPQPRGGIVRETIILETSKDGTKVVGIIHVDYPKGIIPGFLEWFLSKRFDHMLKVTIKNIQKKNLV